jgi:hypothetical protein
MHDTSLFIMEIWRVCIKSGKSKHTADDTCSSWTHGMCNSGPLICATWKNTGIQWENKWETRWSRYDSMTRE